MSAAARLRDYATKPAVRRAVEQARELGLEVAGFEIAPGGVIRVFDKAAFPAPVEDPGNDFDRWRRQDQKQD